MGVRSERRGGEGEREQTYARDSVYNTQKRNERPAEGSAEAES